jgi:hypothetical protein
MTEGIIQKVFKHDIKEYPDCSEHIKKLREELIAEIKNLQWGIRSKKLIELIGDNE